MQLSHVSLSLPIFSLSRCARSACVIGITVAFLGEPLGLVYGEEALSYLGFFFLGKGVYFSLEFLHVEIFLKGFDGEGVDQGLLAESRAYLVQDRLGSC